MSREEAHAHLVTTFDLAANHRPDLLEPWLIMLVDAEQDDAAQMQIMREALRETFVTRWPNRFAKPSTEQKEEGHA